MIYCFSIQSSVIRSGSGFWNIFTYRYFGTFGLVVSALIFGVRVDGWTSLIVSLFFFLGPIMLTVSIIGFYLIRVLEQSQAVYTPFSVSSTLKGVKFLSIDTVFIIGGRGVEQRTTELLRRRPVHWC